VPKITQAYVTSRLDSVRVLLSSGGGGLDEMLDAEEQLSEQLESLPYLVRFQYEKSRCVALGLLSVGVGLTVSGFRCRGCRNKPSSFVGVDVVLQADSGGLLGGGWAVLCHHVQPVPSCEVWSCLCHRACIWAIHMGHTYGPYRWAIHMGHTYGPYIWAIHMGHTCGPYIWAIHMGHTYGPYIWAIHMGHTCGPYMWAIHVGHTCGPYIWAIHMGHTML
jgi:hypothetical protein